VSDDFAPPPTPGGAPAGTVKRTDFRATPPARRRRRFPRWLAALLAVGALVIVGGVAAQIALTKRATNSTPSEADATGRLHSAQVVSGMCLESLGDAAGPVTVVPCEEPHAAEAVTGITLSGVDFPGDESIAQTVLDYCASQLAPGGALDHVASGRQWVAWVPSKGTWSAGDRNGLCIVYADSPWTGPARSMDDRETA